MVVPAKSPTGNRSQYPLVSAAPSDARAVRGRLNASREFPPSSAFLLLVLFQLATQANARKSSGGYESILLILLSSLILLNLKVKI